MKELSKEKFHELLLKIGKQKRSALEEFYSIYGEMIYATAFSVCKSKAVTEEVVDDVLVKVWKTGMAPAEIESPISWVYTVTVNAAKDRRQTATLPLDEDIANSHDAIEKWEERDNFLSLLTCLNESEKEILLDRFMGDMQFSEIAKAMGLPLGTVTSSFYRALEKIKKFL